MTDPAFSHARAELHRLAVHILARSRHQSTGRFSLRVTSGGLGTPEIGADGRRVRLSADALIVESDPPGGATATALPVAGASLVDLARHAGVDLSAPLDVGHDTPPTGDVHRSVELDHGAGLRVVAAFARIASVLDATVVALCGRGRATTVSLPRLWPEHFDVAIETDTSMGRVNLGGSPGDAFCDEPYWYVGPWSDARPGDTAYWNAPFGAYVPAAAMDDDDALQFLRRGVDLLG